MQRYVSHRPNILGMPPKSIPISIPDGSTNKITVFGEANSGPILLIFPAMGVKASYYTPFATALTESGMTAITADLRGLGHSSIRPSRSVDFGYKDMLELDYRAVFDQVEKLFPRRPRIVLGHSLGGQLGALFLSRFPEEAQGLILIAACSVYYKGWPGWQQYRTWFGTQLFGQIAGTLGYFPGHRIGFGGKGAKTTLLDWSRQARTGRYELTNSDFDYEEALGRLKTPLLGISIAGDNLAPRTAMEQLYHKFHPDQELTHFHISAKESQVSGLNHFNWAREPRYFASQIQEWVGAQVP